MFSLLLEDILSDKHCNENTSSRTTHHISMIAREIDLLDVLMRYASDFLVLIPFLLEEGRFELASTFV